PSWLLWTAGKESEIGREGQTLFPAEWFQSVNPVCILGLAPVFAVMWLRLARRRVEPPPPVKMGLGLILTRTPFLFMLVRAIPASRGQAPASWPASLPCIRPCRDPRPLPSVFSLVANLSPARFPSLLMGALFLATCAGNFLSGQCAAKFSYFEEHGFILHGL